MARTEGAKNVKTIEFVQLYDKLVDLYGCPVKALFQIANNKRADKGHRIQAAKTLLPYRYSKRETEKPDDGIQGELYLAWDRELDNECAANQ